MDLPNWNELSRRYPEWAGAMWLDYQRGLTIEHILFKVGMGVYRRQVKGVKSYGKNRKAPTTVALTALLAMDLSNKRARSAAASMELRQALKRATKRAGLTRAQKRLILALALVGTNQTELERLTGIPQQTISRWLPDIFAKIRENLDFSE